VRPGFVLASDKHNQVNASYTSQFYANSVHRIGLSVSRLGNPHKENVMTSALLVVIFRYFISMKRKRNLHNSLHSMFFKFKSQITALSY